MRLRSIVSIAVTALLLCILWMFVDARAVATTLARTSPTFFVLAVVVSALNLFVCSVRYQAIQQRISERKVSLWEITKINVLTLFFAYLLPISAAADGVRVVASSRRFGIAAQQAAEGVIHDRIIAAVGLILCLLLTLPIQLALGTQWPIVLPQLTFAVVALLLWPVLERVGRARFFPRWSARLIGLFTRSPIHVASLRSAAWQIAIALASSLCFALTLYWLARGMAIGLTLMAAIAFAPAVYLSQVMPFFYGGFGAREAVSMALLAGSGAMSAEAAVSLSLAVGISNLVVSLPGALVGADYFSGTRARP